MLLLSTLSTLHNPGSLYSCGIDITAVSGYDVSRDNADMCAGFDGVFGFVRVSLCDCDEEGGGEWEEGRKEEEDGEGNEEGDEEEEEEGEKGGEG
ncbi:hypothetical protein BZA77DRAFT_348556 [Pyronema omphalodes]|nr:hypothetical protein BZA77DRAFT_348556 [Pyronema omphalodes]